MPVNIRPARSDDAPFLAWLVLASGRAHVKRGIWEVIIDEPEDKCLAFLQSISVTPLPHQFHHTCYLLAEVEGHPAAGLGGYDPATLGFSAIQTAVIQVCSKLGMPMPQPEPGDDTSRVLDCVPDDVAGAWIIDSVATLPGFRRQGIVSRLVEEMMEKGRRQGFRRAQIKMYIGNTPAQRVYEKLGFKVDDEKRDSRFEALIGSPGMLSLVRDL